MHTSFRMIKTFLSNGPVLYVKRVITLSGIINCIRLQISSGIPQQYNWVARSLEKFEDVFYFLFKFYFVLWILCRWWCSTYSGDTNILERFTF